MYTAYVSPKDFHPAGPAKQTTENNLKYDPKQKDTSMLKMFPNNKCKFNMWFTDGILVGIMKCK